MATLVRAWFITMLVSKFLGIEFYERESCMHLESEHFIVDQVKHTDKGNLKLLEDSRRWTPIIKETQNVISDKDKSDYFEEPWEYYQSKEYFWCIL